MCKETSGNRINAGEIQNENRFLIFLFIENRLKIPVPRGGGGGGEGVKAEVARLQTRWRSSCREGVFRVACLRQAVYSGNVTPTGGQSLPVSYMADTFSKN